ncbi:MAG: hypothetical protein OXG37_14295 [Actinomycetia bacterium]|nr:hypothetical protein [Actinomycetes bacterium]
MREYLARYGDPGPVFRYGEPDLDSVEHLQRVYPSLTEQDIRRALEETPPPDRLRPSEPVPIDAATGRRRRRDREPAFPEAEEVVSLGDRRLLKRTRPKLPPFPALPPL